MNKSSEKKLVKILKESTLNPKLNYLGRNRFSGEGMKLNYKEASVYTYILDAYSKYLKAAEDKNSKLVSRAIKDYDKSREVFGYLNNKAYMFLID
tara:strand:+ start:662 stop:946 length:285 start_codon:yes stop_codon:yes gene_type:complete